MKKIYSSIGILLLCGAFACSKSSSDTGAAGSQGSAGTPGTAGTSAAGSTGAAGHVDAGTDGFPIMALDGKCVANAYPHEGICMCQPSTPTVCAEGCTDTSADNDNCGACGHACGATATCNNGTCGPSATNILPAISGCSAMQIALAGTTIYYTDGTDGKVSSVGVTGGTPTVIASGESSPGAIIASGTTIYWVTTASSTAAVDGGGTATMSTIRKSVGGAAPTTLVTEVNGSGGIHGLVLSGDGNTVYYSADTKIRGVAVAGGAAKDVANEAHSGIPGTPAILGSTIAYGTGINADVDVIAINPTVVAICGIEDTDGNLIPTSNPGCTRVARSQGGLLLTSMILNGTHAYWGNNSSLESNSATPGGTQNNLAVAASTFGGNISAIAANATTLYFGVKGDYVIEKTPYLAAGATMENTAIPLARAQKDPTSVALDATKVYWSTSDCSISSTGL